MISREYFKIIPSVLRFTNIDSLKKAKCLYEIYLKLENKSPNQLLEKEIFLFKSIEKSFYRYLSA